jgi:hypothetical protein
LYFHISLILHIFVSVLSSLINYFLFYASGFRIFANPCTLFLRASVTFGCLASSKEASTRIKFNRTKTGFGLATQSQTAWSHGTGRTSKSPHLGQIPAITFLLILNHLKLDVEDALQVGKEPGMEVGLLLSVNSKSHSSSISV